MSKIARNLFFAGFLLAGTMLWGQTEAEIRKITADYDKAKLQTMAQEFSEEFQREKQNAIEYAEANDIPLIKVEGKHYSELVKVGKDGTLLYLTTFNRDAAKSTRTNHLHNGGSLGLNLEGQGMTAYVWDGGHARPTHQEYIGRYNVMDNDGNWEADNIGHGAHVTGTIIASGVQAAAKGMAPQANGRGYEWNNDINEMTTAANNYGMLVSNHSYGYQFNAAYAGRYDTDARNLDNLMHNAPYYLSVCAGGNDGDVRNSQALGGSSYDYDKLNYFATAKNNMVVANAQDASVDSNGNLTTSVNIVYHSSQGPTDDLRIKPDITGNGYELYSTLPNSNTSYAQNGWSGTSMASPNVAGSLLLLQQHYNNLNSSFMRSATLKAVALHTADDAGPAGPDVVFGWGLMNAKRAAEVISKDKLGVTSDPNQAIISELTLNNGGTYSIEVESDGINPLMASICWTDPAGTVQTTTNDSTHRLVNDLDIRITKGAVTYYPWRLNSRSTNSKNDNSRDPYERVDIDDASGIYTITVTHKGTLRNGTPQNFSLVVTGITDEETNPCGAGSNQVILSIDKMDNK